MKNAKIAFDRTRAVNVANVAAKSIDSGLYARQISDVEAALRDALRGVTGKAWQKFGAKMLAWLDDYKKAVISGDELCGAPFKVLKKGNGKLPFYTFGTLPVVLCPGAGECATFCYSLKAWRYPAAFFNMLQNSLLLGHVLGQQYIARQFLKLPNGVTFRLYVDGDFSRVTDVIFWASLLGKRQDIATYGYSKSFRQIIDAHDMGYVMPSNYRLNLSSGHNSDEKMADRIKALPCYRGEFIAVQAEKSATNGAMIAAHKMATGRKAFACPGLCGECTSVGHACGSARFDGVDIIIKVH